MTARKRVFDLAFAVPGLVAISPLLAAVAALILYMDGSPVFFRQERVGYKGRRFKMWKFRTMVAHAERRGPSLTVGRDPRITRTGYWLRRFKLDELPQLLNVVKGEMSLVGPRPEVPRYVDLYSPEQRRVLDLVPGITDPASIRYRRENDLLASAADPEQVYIEEIMPAKIGINLEYASRAGLRTDCRVVARTLLTMLR